jgi:uncharacterized protein (DUF2062 family)
MAFGIFIGMTPTIPFHIVVALVLALVFKASKITAAVGTWVCNPATIYFVYKYSYRIGSFILGFDHNTKILAPVAEAINNGELFHIVTKTLGSGGMVVAAFLSGGIVLGIIFGVPSYFIFFYFFKAFISWRRSRKLTRA